MAVGTRAKLRDDFAQVVHRRGFDNVLWRRDAPHGFDVEAFDAQEERVAHEHPRAVAATSTARASADSGGNGSNTSARRNAIPARLTSRPKTPLVAGRSCGAWH